MSNYKSSINQQKKSLTIQENHNDRSISPNYLICKRNIEVNHNATNALKKRNEIISNAIANYQKNCNSKNKKFQAKSYEWSAVCNIKPDTTMEQLKIIADYYEQNLGFQCYQIAIHRDEGHLVSLKDKNITLNAGKDFFLDQKTGIYYKGAVIEKQSKKGEKVLKYVKTNEILAQNIDELKKEYEISINHHAHLEFISLDKTTGKNRSRDLFNDKQKMRELQSKVAEILEMERGADKRISGAERIKPRAYGAMKQREKAERKADLDNLGVITKFVISQRDELHYELSKELEMPYSIANSAKSYISKIKQIKQNNAELEQQIRLNAEIDELKRMKQQALKELETDYREDRERFKCSKKATQRAYSRLKKIHEKRKQQLIDDYKQKEAELKQNIENLEKERDKLKAKLESKNAQNRDFAPTNSAALDTPKTTETTQGVETTQKTEPKIDAPVKEQKIAELDIDKKMTAIDEAIAKTNSPYTYNNETNLEIPRNDFNDDSNTKPFKKR